MRLLNWILLTAFIAAFFDVARAEIKRKRFTAGGAYLIVEVFLVCLSHSSFSFLCLH
jgi:hypothetical protein